MNKYDAERYVYDAYLEVYGLVMGQYKTEPGCPPAPGGLNVTERGASARQGLAKIREAMRGSIGLSVIEVKLNPKTDGMGGHYAAFVDRVYIDTNQRIQKDTIQSYLLWAWRRQPMVSREEWAEHKNIKLTVLSEYESRGWAAMNRLYASAINEIAEIL